MRSKGLEFGANESYNQLKRLRKFTVVFTGPEICRRVLPCRGGVLQSLDTATPQAPPTTFPQRHLRHHQPRSHSDTSGTTNHVPRDTATPQAPPTTFPQRHLRNQPRSQGHSDTSGTTNHVGGWWLVVSEGWWLVVSEGHLCLGTSDTTNQRCPGSASPDTQRHFTDTTNHAPRQRCPGSASPDIQLHFTDTANHVPRQRCPGSASPDTQRAQAPLLARKRGGRRLLRHRAIAFCAPAGRTAGPRGRPAGTSESSLAGPLAAAGDE